MGLFSPHGTLHTPKVELPMSPVAQCTCLKQLLDPIRMLCQPVKIRKDTVVSAEPLLTPCCWCGLNLTKLLPVVSKLGWAVRRVFVGLTNKGANLRQSKI